MVVGLLVRKFADSVVSLRFLYAVALRARSIAGAASKSSSSVRYCTSACRISSVEASLRSQRIAISCASAIVRHRHRVVHGNIGGAFVKVADGYPRAAITSVNKPVGLSQRTARIVDETRLYAPPGAREPIPIAIANGRICIRDTRFSGDEVPLRLSTARAPKPNAHIPARICRAAFYSEAGTQNTAKLRRQRRRYNDCNQNWRRHDRPPGGASASRPCSPDVRNGSRYRGFFDSRTSRAAIFVFADWQEQFGCAHFLVFATIASLKFQPAKAI